MIYCCASDCIHFHNGYCQLDDIGISDDFHQCEEYVDYTDTKEYNTEFWRAVTMNGKSISAKIKENVPRKMVSLSITGIRNLNLKRRSLKKRLAA